ncbi:MAG TPA: Gfo/Idh/MocA family oxidoreductase [Chitinophaga sp.]|uniref:Gfo/Idh/MocA family protein n=1 Tax=Chitinophaga sp. TaxID=1869181 RepID=UPI002BA835A0|nr:Gfo/Idh/MocA family oxidoreductase [Chitinophaga sp.]HVI43691.1 Gfo/Idh/MocA family oxidoreductase [Chitinophaga sp.]
MLSRREFLSTTTAAGIGIGFAGIMPSLLYGRTPMTGRRAGIIGLDTSHSMEIIKALNGTDKTPEFEGYSIVAAYPQGSKDIKSSAERIPAYTAEAQKSGVEITDSIAALLSKVDVVFLETNDGRPRLEQAMEVLKAGKPLFVDKPVAASLKDVAAIYDTAKKYKVPVFSSSSLRYISDAQEIAAGKMIGKVLGADTYSPATLEKTHPDLFWYGIHGVEMLFAVMGTGCKEVSRVHTDGTDVVVGTWKDGRIGIFRGTRTGKHTYGGMVFGEEGVRTLGPFKGTLPLLSEIIKFFKTGVAPVPPEETLEIYSFMAAADDSKARKGMPVSLAEVAEQAGISFIQ